MNAVGIDVSKSKSVVAIMRPFGEIVSTPFEIKHTASDIHSLKMCIRDSIYSGHKLVSPKKKKITKSNNSENS